MAKDPAIMFYCSDFITGTIFMTNEQVGIYIKLLCAQHQHGGLIEKAAFEAMVGEHKIIRTKFIEGEDGFYNKRMMEEMHKREVKSTNLSNSARETWKLRRKNTISLQSHKISYETDMRTEDEDEDEDIIKVKKKKTNTKVLIDYFFDRHLEIHKRKYIVQGAKDTMIFKELLQSATVEELKEKINLFMISTDDFIKEAGYTVGVFKSQVNKLHKQPATPRVV